MRYAAKPGSLQLVVATFSEGLGARMAFDVSVRSAELKLVGEVDPYNGSGWTAELEIPVSSFAAHALHRNHSRKPAELSASDARQIADKTQGKLREAFGSHIRVKLSADGIPEGGALTTTVVAVVDGKGARLELTASAGSSDGSSAEVSFEARGEASLAALGVPKVKAPLGLMVVSDRVELSVTGTLVPL